MSRIYEFPIEKHYRPVPCCMSVIATLIGHVRSRSSDIGSRRVSLCSREDSRREASFRFGNAEYTRILRYLDAYRARSDHRLSIGASQPRHSATQSEIDSES